MGMGGAMAKPWSRGLPWGWLLFGCCLPDLIDKPIYYIHSWTTGLKGAELGLFQGSRTLGHTGMLWLFVVAIGLFGSRAAAAVAMGMFTHLLLDFAADLIDYPWQESSSLQAFFFPLLKRSFAAMPYTDAGDHLSHLLGRSTVVVGEILGAILLTREWLKRRKHRTQA
jgi:hypothetical protein